MPVARFLLKSMAMAVIVYGLILFMAFAGELAAK